MIRKLPGQNKWRVYSEKKVYKKGEGWVHKNLGTYNSLKEAKNRLRQVEYFKRRENKKNG